MSSGAPAGQDGVLGPLPAAGIHFWPGWRLQLLLLRVTSSPSSLSLPRSLPLAMHRPPTHPTPRRPVLSAAGDTAATGSRVPGVRAEKAPGNGQDRSALLLGTVLGNRRPCGRVYSTHWGSPPAADWLQCFRFGVQMETWGLISFF